MTEEELVEKEYEEMVNTEYDKTQCVFGPNSTMKCYLCSHTCQARYKDFLKKGVKIAIITDDGLVDIN